MHAMRVAHVLKPMGGVLATPFVAAEGLSRTMSALTKICTGAVVRQPRTMTMTMTAKLGRAAMTSGMQLRMNAAASY